MAGNFFTGATGRPVVTTVATGATRFNTTNNHYEVYDGTTWVSLGSGRTETMFEMLQYVEDKLGAEIKEEYQDSAAMQDAFKEWEAANERFKIVLALAEKK